MRQILLAALVAFLFTASPVLAQDCGVVDPLWHSCTADSECVESTNVCGFPASYNSKHLEAAQKSNACRAPAVSCAVPPKDPPKTQAYCKQGTCALREVIPAAGTCGQFYLGWLACQQDSDCALTKNACGHDAVYNKTHVEKAAAYNQCLSKQVDCTGHGEETKKVKATCVQNTCALAE